MAQRATFGKLQRERDKQEKAKAKREHRRAASVSDPDELPRGAARVTESPEALLELIADAHRRFERGEIGFEEYDERRSALLARLPIE
jgi:hypothetical protein